MNPAAVSSILTGHLIMIRIDDDKHLELMLHLRSEGKTYQEIGTLLGVAVSRVYRRCNPNAVKTYFKRYRDLYREKRNNFEYRCTSALRKSAENARANGYRPCNAEVEQLVRAFTGHCHCCGVLESNSNKRLAVDHCHKTGIFRGWLCQKCNHAIGLLGDSPQIILQAYTYLCPRNLNSVAEERTENP